MPIDRATTQSVRYPNDFALGDANDLPISKAGSTVHDAADVFVDNFVEHVRGRPMPHAYDGQVNAS